MSGSVANHAPAVGNDSPPNTTPGTRPARAPASASAPKTVPPVYFFNGDTPRGGESYRAALARSVTGDFQFARAAVNYFCAHFFGVGIVDPPDQFDPRPLDPDNTPAGP